MPASQVCSLSNGDQILLDLVVFPACTISLRFALELSRANLHVWLALNHPLWWGITS